MTDKKDKLIEAYRELRNWLDSECPAIAPPLELYDTSDLSHNFCELLRIRLDEIAKLESEPSEQDCINVTDALELASQKSGKKSRSIPNESELTPEIEQETSVFLIERDGNTSKLYKNGKRVSPEEFTKAYGCELTAEQKKLLELIKKQYFDALEPKPQITAELDDQIDDIEREDYLNEVFRDLQLNAYDVDFHGYHFKQANQIIRKYFENFASQFQKPVMSDEDIEKWVEHEIKMPNGKMEQRFIPLLDFVNAIVICYRAGLREGAKAVRNGKIKLKHSE